MLKLKLVTVVTCNISRTAGGVISGGSRFFFLLRSPHTGSGTHSASSAVSTMGSFTGSEVAGHDTDHLPPSGTESENVWKCILSLPDCSVGNEP
jgi:hypothetical protein